MNAESVYRRLAASVGFTLLALAAACGPPPEPDSPPPSEAPPVEVAGEELPKDVDMNQEAPPVPEDPSPKVGERQEVTRREIYGVGAVRPRGSEDLAALGLKTAGETPALVILASEHPDLPPPRLAVDTVGGKPVLVLTWLDYDPMTGPLTEVADVTYAWPVSGPAPYRLAVRKVAGKEAAEAPLAKSGGPEVSGRSLSLEAAEGPGVSLDPAYLVRGAETFFGQFGKAKPPDLGESLLLASVRPTANGRRGRALGAAPLEGGGVRVRIAVPLDPGLPVWGPRVSDRADVFAFTSGEGTCEWLLELE